MAVHVSAQCNENLTAKPGTYKVTMNQDRVDSYIAPYAFTDCYFLEEIESNRKDTQEVTLELGNYIIRVYSRERVINAKQSEE